MGTPNNAERSAVADNFISRYAGATLQLLNGATVLATHTLGDPAAPAAVNGLVTANAIADATFLAAAGAGTTIDGAKLIGSGGAEYDLTVGTSGADVIVSSVTAIENGTSTVNSLTVQF